MGLITKFNKRSLKKRKTCSPSELPWWPDPPQVDPQCSFQEPGEAPGLEWDPRQTWHGEKVDVKVFTATTATTEGRLQCFQPPVGADLHDTDSSLSVSSQDGVKYRGRTSPPRQQAGVDVENPAGWHRFCWSFVFLSYSFRLIQCSLHTSFSCLLLQHWNLFSHSPVDTLAVNMSCFKNCF